MIAKIEAEGLPGLSEPITLDPNGVTHISGPSGAGKSMSLEAVCFALHGTDSQGKPFDAAGFGRTVEVALTMSSGTVVRRRKTTSGSQTRELTPAGGETESFTKEAEFRARLKAMGQDAVRYVLAPLAWVPLAQGAGGGRPLRDLLSSILPPVDLRAIVRETITDLNDSDAVDAKGAEAQRRDARKAADEAAGALGARQSVLDGLALPDDGPGDDELAAARVITIAAEGWGQYDGALAAHTAEVVRAEAQAAAVKDWSSRLAELGERPDDGAAKLQEAERTLTTARDADSAAAKAHAGACDALSRATSAKDAATERRTKITADPTLISSLAHAEEALAALGTGDTCPTCHRDGWADVADERKRATERVKTARDRVEASRAVMADEAKVALESAEIALEAAQAVVKETDAALTAAKAALKTAETDAATAQGYGAAARAWDASHRALGTAPAEPATLAAAPVAPTAPRPTEEDVAAAVALNGLALRAEGARSRYEAEHKQATANLAAAEEAAATATKTAARADQLVDAVRAAPTEAVRRQLAALGDMGPVSLRLSGDGGCEVEVFGRPWQAASTGELVMADVHFRAGLRRALKAPWLAIWVDNRQSWSGELPDVTPRVELRTVEAAGKRLSVAA